MLAVAELAVIAAYVGYAVVVYWRLRTSGELQIEITETRSWVRCTPPWHLFADLLLPAMPLIVELTCAVNGLLWPVEMLTRPWRSRGGAVMPAVQPSVWPVCGEELVAFLDALAAEMTARGWAAYVTTSPGWAPRLFVQHPRLDIVSGTVLATRDQATGEWWYWFGHAERIAPCGSPAEAAEAVGRALSPVSGSAADLAAPRTQHWAEGTRR